MSGNILGFALFVVLLVGVPMALGRLVVWLLGRLS